MSDRPPKNEYEEEARRSLVHLAQSMTRRELSFFEGAVQILRLRNGIGGIQDRDDDFDAFVVIESETDHLPLNAQRSLWSPQALKKLEPEFKQIEVWARSFGDEACAKLIDRFQPRPMV